MTQKEIDETIAGIKKFTDDLLAKGPEACKQYLIDSGILLNSDKNDKPSVATGDASSTDDGSIKKIREKFLKECVSQGHNGVLGYYERIYLSPEQVFEFFKPYLHNPSLPEVYYVPVSVESSDKPPLNTYYAVLCEEDRFNRNEVSYCFHYNGRWDTARNVTHWLKKVSRLESGESQ